jgi:DNA-binding NarL/FixJ family response regulator
MRWIILIYGLLDGVLLILIKFLEINYLIGGLDFKIYSFLLALLFLFGGLYLGWQYNQKVVIQNQLVNLQSDEPMINPTGLLSEREAEVLKHLAMGKTNQQIADDLYVSLNTIKTHLKNIYIKLDVNTKTQALLKARAMKILD